MLLEERDDGRVAFLLRDGQRCAFLRRTIDVGTSLQAESCDFEMAL